MYKVNSITKQYIKLKENNRFSDLEIDFYYDLGGTNYFTYNNEKRGYYISVSPVNRKNGSISYAAFDGVKQLLIETSRKSKKAEAEATEKINNVLKQLIDYVLGKHGLKLEN